MAHPRTLAVVLAADVSDDADELRERLTERLKPHRGTGWFRNWRWGVVVPTDRLKHLTGETFEVLSLQQLADSRWMHDSHASYMRDCVWPVAHFPEVAPRFDAAIVDGGWIERTGDPTFVAKLVEVAANRVFAALVIDDPDLPG